MVDDAQFIAELDVNVPAGTDLIADGDNEIRAVKIATQQTFPNADAAVNLTSAQLNDAALKSAANAFTGINTHANFERFANGSFAAPAITPITDATTGILWSAGFFGVSLGGISRLEMTASTMLVASNQQLNQVGSAGAPSYSFVTNVGTGMYSSAGNVLDLATAGVSRFTLTASELNLKSAQIWLPGNGSAGSPVYSFATDQNTGMYWIQSDDMGWSCGGARRMRLRTTEMEINVPIRAGFGTVAAPTYSFDTEESTGMFRGVAGGLWFGTLGRTRLKLDDSGRNSFLQGSATLGVSLSLESNTSIIGYSIDYEGTAGFQPGQFSISRFNRTTGAFIDIPFYIDAATGRVHTALPVLSP